MCRQWREKRVGGTAENEVSPAGTRDRHHRSQALAPSRTLTNDAAIMKHEDRDELENANHRANDDTGKTS